MHLAAAGIDVDPLRQVRSNLNGLLNVFEFAADWGVGRVVTASTIGVYAGSSPALAYREDAPLPMNGLHGIQASKKSAEIIADLANRCGVHSVVSLRLPAVWGPRGHPDSRFFALPRLVHAAAHRHTSQAVRDEAIDMLYVKDCAAAIAAILGTDHLTHTVYNVGSGRVTSNAEVADAVTRVAPEARIALTDSQAGGALASTPAYLDITRLLEDTHYQPRYGLDAGIGEYIEWLHSGHER